MISAIYTANEDLSVAIPWQTAPEKTQGTEILSVVLAASSPTAPVKVEFDAQGVHNTSNVSMVAALFVDDESFARRSSPSNPAGPGFLVPMALRYSWVPGDTLPHTYRIRVGALSGAMRLNGMATTTMFGGTMAATLFVEEK